MSRIVYAPALFGLGIATWRLGSGISDVTWVREPFALAVSIALYGLAGSFMLGALQRPIAYLSESRWVRKWFDSQYARWEERLSDRTELIKKAKDDLARALGGREGAQPQDTASAAAQLPDPRAAAPAAAERPDSKTEAPAAAARGLATDNQQADRTAAPHDSKKA